MGIKGLQSPPFSEPLSHPVFFLMRTYNRRFAQIARRRRRLDLLGKTNRAHRCLANGFTLSRSDIRLIFKTILRWGWLELREGWGKGKEKVSVSVSVPGREERTSDGEVAVSVSVSGGEERSLTVPDSKEQETSEGDRESLTRTTAN
jgi:hypothetical protein